MLTRDSDQGIALIMVLWVLTILMVIVLSFSLATRTDTYGTLAFKEGVEKKLLAEAGVERAVMELFYAVQNRGQTVILEGREVWKTDGTSYQGELGNGAYTVSIIDESGKFDINRMTEQSAIIMKNILIGNGVSETDADIITDSMLDWKDTDDLRHLNGVESEYYQSLPSPYKAKNANFDTVEELLLVKGVSSDILYGSGERKGIIQYLTVNSPSGQINVNAAPREVLIAVPGITPEIAEGIISRRESADVTGQQDVVIPAESAAFVTYTGGNTFTVESVGRRQSETTGYAVRATVLIEGSNKFRYRYYKMPADIRQ